MIQVLEQSNNFIATKAVGKLTEQDYDLLLPLVNGLLDRYPKARWYFEMEDFEGWKPQALWEDLQFDVRHANDFNKIAMVGDKKWEKWMTDLMKPFTSADVKYFNNQEREKAWQWIRN